MAQPPERTKRPPYGASNQKTRDFLGLQSSSLLHCVLSQFWISFDVSLIWTFLASRWQLGAANDGSANCLGTYHCDGSDSPLIKQMRWFGSLDSTKF